MKPYEHYKETGMNWFPKIPAHWGMVRNGVLFSEVVDTGYNDLELLSITTDKGIIKQTDTGRKKRASDDMAKYKRIRPGDIGYNLMNAFMGAIGMSDYEGIISPAYAVCRPKVNLDSRYYHYLFRTPLYKQEFDKNSYGIMYERNRLYFDHFASISVPAPDIKEQNTIVAYIQTAEEKIDKYIETKQKEISVLEEYKQTIINEAVTKGLDRTVPMKDSGIEWIGEIPAHWEVSRLKNLVTSNEESLGENTPDDFTFRYIDIGTVVFGKLTDNPVQYHFKNAPVRARRIIHEGDTIISTVRTYLKSMLFIDDNLKDCIVSTGFSVLTPRANIIPHYLSIALSADYFITNVVRHSVGISYPAISDHDLLSLPVVYPPNKREQEEIYQFSKRKLQKVDGIIENMTKQIEQLNEYRTTLISDVVTGQVNVCENP